MIVESIHNCKIKKATEVKLVWYVRGHTLETPVKKFDLEAQEAQFHHTFVLAAKTNVDGREETFDKRLTLIEF